MMMTQTLQHGGWVLAAIFALSIGAWAMIVWKWLELRSELAGGLHWAQAALDRLAGGDRPDALRLCLPHSNLVGRLMVAALRTDEPQRRFFDKHLQPVLDSETLSLQRHLDLIAVAAAAAPLLGLLGTVLGMVTTFDAMSGQAVAETDRLATGISQALVTTQAGLVVALPIVLIHNYLSSAIQRYIDRTTLYVKKIETILCKD